MNSNKNPTANPGKNVKAKPPGKQPPKQQSNPLMAGLPHPGIPFPFVAFPFPIAAGGVKRSHAAMMMPPVNSKFFMRGANNGNGVVHSSNGMNKAMMEEKNAKNERRKEKNRESARACRRRKKEVAKELEQQVQLLEVDNLKLRLQLKIGEEAEDLGRSEETRLTKDLAELIQNGASEKEVTESILHYTEKFADYGRDRRSAIDFHLRNVARLLKPTTTTTVAMRALEGNTEHNQHHSPLKRSIIGTECNSSDCAKSNIEKTSLPEDCKNGTKLTGSTSGNIDKSDKALSNTNTSQDNTATVQEKLKAKVPVAPKQLFQYLVDYLEVNEVQAKALRDSRKVAKELDSALEQSLVMLEELKRILIQCGTDLETEIDAIRKILNPTQVAKFLVWVQNNRACMHMLNELWQKEYNSKSADEDKKSCDDNKESLTPSLG